MPYIDPALRHPLEHDNDVHPMDAGQLNFAITRTIHHYLERRGVRYATLNEVIGVLECAKLELYRRVVAPYEEIKIAQNGDVFPRIDNPSLKGIANAPAPDQTPGVSILDPQAYDAAHREAAGIPSPGPSAGEDFQYRPLV